MVRTSVLRIPPTNTNPDVRDYRFSGDAPQQIGFGTSSPDSSSSAVQNLGRNAIGGISRHALCQGEPELLPTLVILEQAEDASAQQLRRKSRLVRHLNSAESSERLRVCPLM